MIILGEEVRDWVTEFRGIVVARVETLCDEPQYKVQAPGLKEDGSLKDAYWFVEGRLVQLEKSPILSLTESAEREKKPV